MFDSPRPSAHLFFRCLLLTAMLSLLATGHLLAQEGGAGTRPMNFMDVQLMKGAGSWAPDPSGQWMLYTVSTPDWEKARSQSDIHLVSLTEGLPSHRQLTFTEDDSETSPAWAPAK